MLFFRKYLLAALLMLPVVSSRAATYDEIQRLILQQNLRSPLLPCDTDIGPLLPENHPAVEFMRIFLKIYQDGGPFETLLSEETRPLIIRALNTGRALLPNPVTGSYFSLRQENGRETRLQFKLTGSGQTLLGEVLLLKEAESFLIEIISFDTKN
jgi:hypothetical protein